MCGVEQRVRIRSRPPRDADRRNKARNASEGTGKAGVSGAPGGPASRHLRNMVLYPALQRADIKREPRSYGFDLFRHTAGSIVHELTSDLKLSRELLAHSHIPTTADIYVHGTREAKAGKATELLASQFVPVFFGGASCREQELVSEMVQ
jgi:integrase